MHTDEAVHAEKFKALHEDGFYAYDPDEFHGPTLNYFTLISARLRGEKTFLQISEVTLRIVPAVFGIGLILTPLFFPERIQFTNGSFCQHTNRLFASIYLLQPVLHPGNTAFVFYCFVFGLRVELCS